MLHARTHRAALAPNAARIAAPALAAADGGAPKTQADANNDGKAGRTEAVDRARARFAALDADGGGGVKPGDCAACREPRAGTAADRALAPRGESEADAVPPRTAGPIDDATGELRDAVFEAVDADDNGTITRLEWARAGSAAFDPESPDVTRAKGSDLDADDVARALGAHLFTPPMPEATPCARRRPPKRPGTPAAARP